MGLEVLAQEIGKRLTHRHLMLVAAESCTGGWIAQVVTSVPGSSRWFERGFVTYSNTAKHELLGVPEDIIERHGAVSEQTVRAMAEGALKYSHGDVAVAVSGIAGPSGGEPDKPVGTVFFAWAGRGRETQSTRRQFHGDRRAIRRRAVETALQGVLAIVDDMAGRSKGEA